MRRVDFWDYQRNVRLHAKRVRVAQDETARSRKGWLDLGSRGRIQRGEDDGGTDGPRDTWEHLEARDAVW
jgi:hypothetical protein